MSYLALLIFSLLAFTVKRGTAFGLLIASMIVWPEYVRFEVFITQMSVSRFVAIIILIKWWRSARLEINLYDKLIIGYWLVSILMQILAGTDTKELIRIIGRCMDTVFMYYAARVCLTNTEEFKRFVDFIKYPVIIATFLALKESSSATSIYTNLRAAVAWTWSFDEYEARMGSWVRAFGTTIQPIYWGMTMCLVFMMYASSTRLFQKRFFSFPLVVIGLGVFSALSSGPLGSMLIVILMSLFITSKHRFKMFLRVAFIFSLIIEIFSNRHFYDMAQYLALNSTTAWYRSQLITVAFKNWSEYFFFGVGGNWPNHWGPQIDGRGIVDVVNQYIIVALYGGIVLLSIYVYILLKPLTVFYKSWTGRLTPILDAQRVLAFSLIAIIMAGFTVGFFNPFELLIYMMLGMMRQLQIMYNEERLGLS